MDALQRDVADLVAILATIGGIYFFVGFVVNLAQAQVSTVTGDTLGRARALQQGITTVILLCVAVSAFPISESICTHFNTLGAMESAHSKQTLIAFWGSLANMIVTAVTGISITLLTVSAVFNGFGLQVSKMIGLPIGVARSAGNVITIIIGLALSLAAVSIARGIVDAVFKIALV